MSKVLPCRMIDLAHNCMAVGDFASHFNYTILASFRGSDGNRDRLIKWLRDDEIRVRDGRPSLCLVQLLYNNKKPRVGPTLNIYVEARLDLGYRLRWTLSDVCVREPAALSVRFLCIPKPCYRLCHNNTTHADHGQVRRGHSIEHA